MTAETYPCEKCGKPRTKAEGGTTFTVCDACWGLAADDIMHQQKAEIQALKGVYADNVQLKAEIEALKAERDEWRDKAGLHQIASEAHKALSEKIQKSLRGDVHGLKTERNALRAEVARLEGLIVESNLCTKPTAESCDRNCALSQLHAEARAIKARQGA